MPRAADILLADDERALRVFLKEALERRGFSVRCAPDGERALAMYRARRPDLLILDVMMPGMGGCAVCEAVRREDAETPVLFLTALDSEADELRGLGAGADAYVPKTVSEEVLVARIAAALPGRDFAVITQSGRPALLLVDPDISLLPANNPAKEAPQTDLQGKLRNVMAGLPRGQQLSAILFTDRPLPRTATGKVKRWELQS